MYFILFISIISWFIIGWIVSIIIGLSIKREWIKDTVKEWKIFPDDFGSEIIMMIIWPIALVVAVICAIRPYLRIGKIVDKLNEKINIRKKEKT